MPYIEKRIKSGPMLEIERYAIAKNGARMPRRGKEKPSSEAQANLNDKNAKKKIIRLLNANFTTRDLFVNLTFEENIAEADTKREARNYIRRIEALRKKKGLPPNKYIMVVERGDRGRWHIHIVMSGDGVTMDEIEALWKKGRVNLSRLRPDEFGLEGLARYIVKHRQGDRKNGLRRWSQSLNLKQPVVTRRKVEKINIYREPLPPKGYRILEVEMGDNIFSGPWQYITLTKIEAEKK